MSCIRAWAEWISFAAFEEGLEALAGCFLSAAVLYIDWRKLSRHAFFALQFAQHKTYKEGSQVEGFFNKKKKRGWIKMRAGWN